MIDAKQARELTDLSGIEAKKYLKNVVEPAIKTAAGKGLRKVEVYVIDVETFQRPNCPKMQSAAIEVLRELGFKAFWGNYGEPYIPVAMTDDDGNGPNYHAYGLIISW